MQPRSLVARVVLASLSIIACGRLDESPAPDTPAKESWVAEPLPPDTSHREVSTSGACTGLPGTDEELALTPRADEEAEGLALLVDGTFVASTASYERIRRDMAAIRAHVPEVRAIRGREFVPVVNVIVGDAPTIATMESGDYHAWDCLHARYGWDKASFSDSPPGWQSATGWLNGRYASDQIEALYEQLPSVREARTGAGFSDGSRICATRETDDTFHYVFDDASGDCESGCISHHRYYFVSSADGRIGQKGEYPSGDNVDNGDNAEFPDWILAYGHERCNR